MRKEPPHMSLRPLAVAVLAAAALTTAACGGDAPSSSGTSGDSGAKRGLDPETKQAMLDFARCMREHGVDMPDPQFSAGRVTQQGGRGVTPEKERTAEAACKHFQDKIKPPPLSTAEKEKFKQQALADARC